MSDYQMMPKNSIQEQLDAEGYRVWWLPSTLYQAKTPDGETVYYGKELSNAWTEAYKHSQSAKQVETHTDCRSETGKTVGLIDAIITMSRVLAERDLSAPEVQEALKDLRQDEDLRSVLEAAKPDPLAKHKCEMIAKCTDMDEGREFWIGKLLEPIEGFPHETHCLHITTPVKSVVFGVMHGDAAVMAVAAQIIHKDTFGSDKPINPHYIDLVEVSYRNAAEKKSDE